MYLKNYIYWFVEPMAGDDDDIVIPALFIGQDGTNIASIFLIKIK